MSEKTLRLIRLHEVEYLVGKKRSQIYEDIKKNRFPAPCSIGVRAVAWDSRAITKWQEEKIAAGKSPAKSNRMERLPEEPLAGKTSA